MKKPSMVLAFLLAALALAGAAQAHVFQFHPSLAKRSLAGRAAGQRLVIYHDRAMIRLACGQVVSRRFVLLELPVVVRPDPLAVRVCSRHRAELRWTSRELRQTLALQARAAAKARASRSRFSTPSGGGWISSTATWYGPGFYNQGPACDGFGVLTERSWWVATVPKQCGRMFTICDGSRCVRAPGGDTGGFAAGNFDLTPAVARALGGLHTHSVKYRVG